MINQVYSLTDEYITFFLFHLRVPEGKSKNFSDIIIFLMFFSQIIYNFYLFKYYYIVKL